MQKHRGKIFSHVLFWLRNLSSLWSRLLPSSHKVFWDVADKKATLVAFLLSHCSKNFPLVSYYLTHSPRFLKTLYNASCCQLDKGMPLRAHWHRWEPLLKCVAFCVHIVSSRLVSLDPRVTSEGGIYEKSRCKIAFSLYNQLCRRERLNCRRSMQTPYKKIITSFCGGWREISRFCGRISVLVL